MRPRQCRTCRLTVPKIQDEIVKGSVYYYVVRYGRPFALFFFLDDFSFKPNINAVRVVYAYRLVFKLCYFIFEVKHVFFQGHGGIHKLVVVFGHHESSDPSAGRIEPRLLAAYVPRTSLELKYLALEYKSVARRCVPLSPSQYVYSDQRSIFHHRFDLRTRSGTNYVNGRMAVARPAL